MKTDIWDVIIEQQDATIHKLKDLRNTYASLEQRYRELDSILLTLDEKVHLLDSILNNI